MSRIKRRKRKVVPVLKLFPVQVKKFRSPPARIRAPSIRENHSTNVPKQRGDFRQSAATSTSGQSSDASCDCKLAARLARAAANPA
jgi:hypothetical protein